MILRCLASSQLQTMCSGMGEGPVFTSTGDPVSLRIFWLHGVQYLTILGTDPKEYLASIANKEIEWARQYGQPVELDFPHNGVFPGKSPEHCLCLLNKYLALTPYILPEDVSDSFPCLSMEG